MQSFRTPDGLFDHLFTTALRIPPLGQPRCGVRSLASFCVAPIRSISRRCILRVCCTFLRLNPSWRGSRGSGHGSRCSVATRDSRCITRATDLSIVSTRRVMHCTTTTIASCLRLSTFPLLIVPARDYCSNKGVPPLDVHLRQHRPDPLVSNYASHATAHRANCNAQRTSRASSPRSHPLFLGLLRSQR
ncbi:hypothetical protein GY45DRAFT_333729 [Cubamyces sp. BRFM 1775]|nr:hypothetical protein GY45DRAFT_333729 [Cubamyces sp. BRFM 1775]